jgi:hypothetical protein
MALTSLFLVALVILTITMQLMVRIEDVVPEMVIWPSMQIK